MAEVAPASSPRHAVITGAAGAIGRALVSEFTQAGYGVIATDRLSQPDGLACAHWLQLDVAETVRETAAAERSFAQLRAWLCGQGLHVLVNNAATQVLGGADTLTRDDWRHTLDVNLLAPFFWLQALLPELELAQGSVINVSSIHARITKPDFVAYATSKSALSGMTRALAVDLKGRVRVNAIEPAAIDTQMLRDGFANYPEGLADLAACHPIGRVGRAEEVARLALAIAGDTMSFLHGTCVGLDGGISARLFDPG